MMLHCKSNKNHAGLCGILYISSIYFLIKCLNFKILHIFTIKKGQGAYFNNIVRVLRSLLLTYFAFKSQYNDLFFILTMDISLAMFS